MAKMTGLGKGLKLIEKKSINLINFIDFFSIFLYHYSIRKVKLINKY